jgi:hypothetical protein
MTGVYNFIKLSLLFFGRLANICLTLRRRFMQPEMNTIVNNSKNIMNHQGMGGLIFIMTRDYAAASATAVKKWFLEVPTKVQSREGLSCFGQNIFREPE